MSEQASVLSRSGNVAVVQLPGRNYPGLLIQGDTLWLTQQDILEARTALAGGDTEEAAQALEGISERLAEYLAVFESTLTNLGIELPYKK